MALPHAQGNLRPIGISAFEDTLVQDAVREGLEAIDEPALLDCSEGFRPGRRAHDASRTLHRIVDGGEGYWIDEADSVSCFDSVDRTTRKERLGIRMADGSLVRRIGTGVHVGVLDGDTRVEPELSTAQGSVLLPLLGNISLYYALDLGCESEVKPRLQGQAPRLRDCDDFLIGCEREDDARRVVAVLDKRMGRFGRALYPDTTRLLPCRRPPKAQQKGKGPTTFDLLGVTCSWARARKGNWWMTCTTRRASFRRAQGAIADGCRRHRPWPIKAQPAALHRRVRGHCNDCGVRGNSARMMRRVEATKRSWDTWRRRRSQRTRLHGERFSDRLRWWPLPRPRITVRRWDGEPRATSFKDWGIFLGSKAKSLTFGHGAAQHKQTGTGSRLAFRCPHLSGDRAGTTRLHPALEAWEQVGELTMNVTRRDFLKAMEAAAAALVAPAVLSGKAWAARDHEMNILCWEGYNSATVLDPFRSAHDATVKAVSLTNDPTMISRLRAGETNVWDLINVNNPWARKVMYPAGLIKPLDRARFEPYFDKMLPRFKPPYKWAMSEDGKALLGMCQRFGPYSFVVNTKKISRKTAEDQGWDLWNDPANTGKYGILESDDWNVFDFFLIAGINPFVEHSDVDFEKFDATAKKVFKGAKVVGNIVTMNRALIAGEIDFHMSGGTYSASPARYDGHPELRGVTPLKSVIPGKGGVSWIEVTSTVNNPQLSPLATQFLEYVQNPETAHTVAFAEGTFNPVAQMANKKCFDLFTKEELDAIQWDSLDEEMARSAEYDIVPDYERALDLMTAAKRKANGG